MYMEIRESKICLCGSHVKLVSIIKAASQGQNLQIVCSWFGWQGLRHFVQYLLIDHCHMNYISVFIGNSLSGLLVWNVEKHSLDETFCLFVVVSHLRCLTCVQIWVISTQLFQHSRLSILSYF